MWTFMHLSITKKLTVISNLTTLTLSMFLDRVFGLMWYRHTTSGDLCPASEQLIGCVIHVHTRTYTHPHPHPHSHTLHTHTRAGRQDYVPEKPLFLHLPKSVYVSQIFKTSTSNLLSFKTALKSFQIKACSLTKKTNGIFMPNWEPSKIG